MKRQVYEISLELSVSVDLPNAVQKNSGWIKRHTDSSWQEELLMNGLLLTFLWVPNIFVLLFQCFAWSCLSRIVIPINCKGAYNLVLCSLEIHFSVKARLHYPSPTARTTSHSCVRRGSAPWLHDLKLSANSLNFYNNRFENVYSSELAYAGFRGKAHNGYKRINQQQKEKGWVLLLARIYFHIACRSRGRALPCLDVNHVGVHHSQ